MEPRSKKALRLSASLYEPIKSNHLPLSISILDGECKRVVWSMSKLEEGGVTLILRRGLLVLFSRDRHKKKRSSCTGSSNGFPEASIPHEWKGFAVLKDFR